MVIDNIFFVCVRMNIENDITTEGGRIMFYQLDLKQYFNSKGITNLKDATEGSLDEFAQLSLPMHHFQDIMYHEGIPFNLELNSTYDNLSVERETRITFQRNYYTDLYVLGACNNGNFFNEIKFYEGDKLAFSQKIHLSDIMEDIPYKENKKFLDSPYVHSPNGYMYIKTSLWVEHLKFKEKTVIDSLILEENPFVHIFAITLGGRG